MSARKKAAKRRGLLTREEEAARLDKVPLGITELSETAVMNEHWRSLSRPPDDRERIAPTYRCKFMGAFADPEKIAYMLGVIQTIIAVGARAEVRINAARYEVWAFMPEGA